MGYFIKTIFLELQKIASILVFTKRKNVLDLVIYQTLMQDQLFINRRSVGNFSLGLRILKI